MSDGVAGSDDSDEEISEAEEDEDEEEGSEEVCNIKLYTSNTDDFSFINIVENTCLVDRNCRFSISVG